MGEDITNRKWIFFLQSFGWVFLFSLWFVIAEFQLVPSGIVPHPIAKTYTLGDGSQQTKGVVYAFGELLTTPEDKGFMDKPLIKNSIYSIYINLAGYIEAVIAAVLLGFLIGLEPRLKTMFLPQINAIRYLPLPSTTGFFMAMFGMGLMMKINFLAFGIFIYLLPTVIQRIEETDKVHLQTIRTLNPKWWQKLTKVYIPSVLSRVAPDVIVLVALSWTYIVIIEVINNRGGLGGLIAGYEKGRSDVVYALLMTIIAIGYIFDKVFKSGERKAYKWKYE